MRRYGRPVWAARDARTRCWRVPVAAMHGSPTARLRRPSRAQAQTDRAPLGGLEDRCAGCAPAGHDVVVREAPAVAVPGRDDRVASVGGAHELPGGGAATAMMRDDHDIGVQRQTVRQQASLHASLDVSRQQERLRRRGDAQHAGAVVVRRGSSLAAAFMPTTLRIKKLEAHAIPGPRFATTARFRNATSACHARTVSRCADGEGGSQRWCAAGVIAVRMAQHEHVDAAHALMAQERHYGEISRRTAAAKRGPGVVEQNVPVRTNDHRQALAHVQRVHLELSLARRGVWCKRERQKERNTQRSQLPRQRHDRDQRGDDQSTDQPRRRRAEVHECPGQGGEPFE